LKDSNAWPIALRSRFFQTTSKKMKKQSVKTKNGTGKDSSGKTRQANGNHDTPRGRTAITEAILQATETLLAKHNPTEISLRQIAEAANINYSLIHRYFGTKENVIMAAHERILGKASAQYSGIDRIDGNIGEIFKIGEKNPSRRILLARAMLDGADPHLIQHHFPIMHQLIELIRKKKSETENPSEFDAETLAAFFSGSVMGWLFFEPFLLASTGLENKDKEKVHSQLVEILEKTTELLC
jgi:TetR/AcrR family transcriptional regulator, repressor for neighboring sulfatase